MKGQATFEEMPALVVGRVFYRITMGFESDILQYKCQRRTSVSSWVRVSDTVRDSEARKMSRVATELSDVQWPFPDVILYVMLGI